MASSQERSHSARLAEKVSRKGLDSMSHFVMKWVGTEDFSVVKRSCVANNDSPLVVGARVSVKVPDASGRMQRYDGDILARGTKTSMETTCSRIVNEGSLNQSTISQTALETVAPTSDLDGPLVTSSPLATERKRKGRDQLKVAKKTRVQEETKEGECQSSLEERYQMAKGKQKRVKGAKGQREQSTRGDDMTLEDQYHVAKSRRNGVRETKGQWEQDNELVDVTLEAPYHATKSRRNGVRETKGQDNELDDVTLEAPYHATKSRRNGVRETKGQWEQDNELDDVTLEAPYHATKSKRNGVRETKGQWEQEHELDDVTLEEQYHATKNVSALPGDDVCEDSYGDSYAIQLQILRKVKDIADFCARIEARVEQIEKRLEAAEQDENLCDMKKSNKKGNPIIYNGVDLTTLGEHKQPQKYARKLLLQLFSVEELACGTYKKLGHTSRSELDSERVAILEECLQRRFDQKTLDKFQMTIINSLNQKCREVINKKRITEKISKQRMPSYVGTSDEESSDS